MNLRYYILNTVYLFKIYVSHPVICSVLGSGG